MSAATEAGPATLSESLDLDCDGSCLFPIVAIGGLADEKPIDNPKDDSRKPEKKHQCDVQNPEPCLTKIESARAHPTDNGNYRQYTGRASVLLRGCILNLKRGLLRRRQALSKGIQLSISERAHIGLVNWLLCRRCGVE